MQIDFYFFRRVETTKRAPSSNPINNIARLDWLGQAGEWYDGLTRSTEISRPQPSVLAATAPLSRAFTFNNNKLRAIYKYTVR